MANKNAGFAALFGKLAKKKVKRASAEKDVRRGKAGKKVKRMSKPAGKKVKRGGASKK